jgi:hypothetical protein
MKTLPRLSVALAGAGLLAGCNVDRQAVFDQVYACDPTAADPGCGTDRQDEPMMCFAGRPLGGTDFCAERCPDGAGSAPTAAVVCSQSGARLAACDPSAPDSCGNRRLGCFRNNVLADGGVCVTIKPCTVDRDCPDPVRSRCATSFVNKIYETPTAFKNDHLWCLQADCQRHRTACSPGETCLRDVVPPGLNPPDICVPSCDSQLRCPPAHVCYNKVYGPQAAAICIPGLLGFRCDSNLDCMMGECVETGSNNLKVCSKACTDEAQCARYDGEQGKFICNPDHACMTPDSFRGQPCEGDGDCDGQICAHLSGEDAQGNCQPACDAGGRCPARGGIPHTCLPLATGAQVCLPGYFELPCTTDDQCLPGLSCRATGEGRPSICTSLCATNEDCARVRWSKGAVCQPLPGMGIKICQSPRTTGPQP